MSVSGDFTNCAVNTILKVTLLDSTDTAISNGTFDVTVIAADGTVSGLQVRQMSDNIAIVPSTQVLASDVKKITVTTAN